MVVLITGASSGIGRALAMEYARRGESLILFARREYRLKEVAAACGGRALFVAGDVTRPEDLARAVSLAKEKFGRLDIVIANAGFGVSKTIGKLSKADLTRQLEVNLFGVLNTVQASLSELRLTRGQMVLVGSAMSYISIPGTGAYTMSKFAVKAMANTLRLEERDISVSLVCPGFIESEIRAVDNDGVFHEGAKDPLPKFLVMSAEQAARQIARGIASRKREIVITWHAKIGIFLERIFPGIMTHVWRRLR